MRGGLWLGGLLLKAGLMAQIAGSVTSLSSLRDQARPLLIFAETEQDMRFQRQAAILAGHLEGLHERQVIGVGMPAAGGQMSLDTRIWSTASPKLIAEERSRLHVGSSEFIVVLIGKDGGEKRRWTRPVSVDELKAVIDAMPGRQDEMRQQGTKPPSRQ